MFKLFTGLGAKREEAFRITDIYIPPAHYIEGHSPKGYPYVTASDSSMTEEPLEEYINDGWTYYYDQYMGFFRYRKDVDIRELISTVQVLFIKKADKRDSITFGFTEGDSMSGAYTYDIPNELREEIAQYKYRNYRPESDGGKYGKYTPMDRMLRDKIIKCCAGNIIDDEYNALVEFDEQLRTTGTYNINNPSYKNSMRSRSYRIVMKYDEGSRKLYEEYCKP